MLGNYDIMFGVLIFTMHTSLRPRRTFQCTMHTTRVYAHQLEKKKQPKQFTFQC